MKILLSSLLILSFTYGIGQITITSSDFAQGGDTAMVSISNETTLDLVTTGADATWDFSTINIYYQVIDTFYDISQADLLYQAVFNNGFTNAEYESDWFKPWDADGLDQLSQFGVSVTNLYQFTAVLSDRVQNTGVGFEIQGTGVPAEMDTIDVQYELPINYLDAWNNSSYIDVDLNPAYDAIYRRYQWRDAVVDGWGTIITPWGSFDALRVRTEVVAIDSVYSGQFGTWFELPTPDQVEYHWFTNGQKLPIFSVLTNDVGGNETITEIRFKDKFRNIVSVEENAIEVDMYPNPANDLVNIQTNENVDVVSIFDLNGRLIYSKKPSSNALVINTAKWSSGVYTVQIQLNSGISTEKLIIE